MNRADQIEALSRIVEEISGELDLDELLARIIEQACRLTGADDGAVGLHDRVRDVIRIAAVHNLPLRELGSELRAGQGLAGAVLKYGGPVMCRYGDLPDILVPELADNAVIGLPVNWRGELIGFFGIGAKPPREFSADDVLLLELFARHVAAAIHTPHRYREEKRRAARFALIARIGAIIQAQLGSTQALLQSAADAIHDLLEYPNVDIPLIDPADPGTLIVSIRGGAYKHAIQQVDRIPITRGIMGAAAREKRSQLVNDVAADPRYVTPPGVKAPAAELAVPILRGDEVLGVLNVEGDAQFDAFDQQSLEIIADHLALAIQNARLHEQAKSAAVLNERQRLARELHDNVTQILSSISLLSQTLESAYRRDPAEGAKRVQRLQQLSQTAFAEMRMLLRELAPPAASGSPDANVSRRSRTFAGLERLKEHALPGALKRLLEAMAPEDLALRLDFAQYTPQKLDAEETLYRVCQEAVSNVIRHAQSRKLIVSAAVTRDQIVLQVADEGRGIGNEFRPGLGLSSMRTRLETAGGHLRVTPNSPRGTLIEARLPRADRAV
jgi:signal transduction histidine kinase